VAAVALVLARAQRLGVRDDRGWRSGGRDDLHRPVSARARLAPDFANSLTISNAASGHYALR
jgi:hypothetical protein